MPLPSQTLPTIGAPNSTEDVKIRNCLLELQTILTGGVDATNVLANTFATLAGLQQLANMGMQAGVIAAGDLMVTQRGAGVNMSADVAAGSALVSSSTSGLLVAVSAASVTNVTISAAHATNPRIDQIVIDTAGAISVLAGVAAAGATLDNRTGAVALPAGSLRLADVLVPAASVSVSNTSIRDRRPWARGINFRVLATPGNYTRTVNTFAAIDSTNLNPRLECSNGNLLHVALQGTYQGSATGAIGFRHTIDGATPTETTDLYNYVSAASLSHSINAWAMLAPSAGSHLIAPHWALSSAWGTGTLIASAGFPLVFTVREIVAQNSKNNSTTSG